MDRLSFGQLWYIGIRPSNSKSFRSSKLAAIQSTRVLDWSPRHAAVMEWFEWMMGLGAFLGSPCPRLVSLVLAKQPSPRAPTSRKSPSLKAVNSQPTCPFPSVSRLSAQTRSGWQEPICCLSLWVELITDQRQTLWRRASIPNGFRCSYCPCIQPYKSAPAACRHSDTSISGSPVISARCESPLSYATSQTLANHCSRIANIIRAVTHHAAVTQTKLAQQYAPQKS